MRVASTVFVSLDVLHLWVLAFPRLGGQQVGECGLA